MSLKPLYLTILLTAIHTFCCVHASVRFALITDTHISTKDTLNTLHLKQVVELINSVDSIDFVVITGDITHSADSGSFVVAKQVLDCLTYPYYCIPGNHDMHNASVHNFQHAFVDDKFCIHKNNFSFIGFPAIPLQGTSEAVVMDSTLLWLQQQTTHSKTILFTHYPLQQGDIKNLPKLSQHLSQHQVILTLSGHYHRYMLLNYKGMPNIVHRAPQRTGDNTIGYTLYHITHESIQIYEHIYGKSPCIWMSFPHPQINQ